MDFKHIIFDFDGVLAETNEIRFDGFQEVFKGYPPEQLATLDRWSRANGGLSRYVKIKHFFNSIREERVSEERVSEERLAGYVKQLVESDATFSACAQLVQCQPEAAPSLTHIVLESVSTGKFLLKGGTLSNIFSMQ